MLRNVVGRPNPPVNPLPRNNDNQRVPNQNEPLASRPKKEVISKVYFGATITS